MSIRPTRFQKCAVPQLNDGPTASRVSAICRQDPVRDWVLEWITKDPLNASLLLPFLTVAKPVIAAGTVYAA